MPHKPLKVGMFYPWMQLLKGDMPKPDGNLSLPYLAGSLDEIGIDAEIVDLSVGPEDPRYPLSETFDRQEMQENGLFRIGMSLKDTEEYLGRKQFDIVAINNDFTPQTKMAFLLAEVAKRVNPQSLVITGGVNARALHERFAKTGNFDLLCTTEGENVIQEIALRRMHGRSYEGVPGTRLFKGEKNILTPPGPGTWRMNLDDLPIPAWHKLPLDRYAAVNRPHGVDLTGAPPGKYAPIMTSRGCPFQCEYCHVSKERFDRDLTIGNVSNIRFKSVERVIREFEILRDLGVTRVYWEDDSLGADKKRVQKILKLVTDMGFTFAGINGMNLVHLFINQGGKLVPDEDYIQSFYDAGWRQLTFTPESGSQKTLDRWASGKLNLEKHNLVALARVFKRIGIVFTINILIGFPEEREEDMMKSVELAKRLMDAGANYTSIFVVIPYPGCRLGDYAVEHGLIPHDFDTDMFKWTEGIMRDPRPGAVSLERIREIQREANEMLLPESYKRLRKETAVGQKIK